MISKNIFLTGVEDVMEFVNQTERCSYEIDIEVDNCVINAKSILGMLCKGVHRVIQLDIHAEKADDLLDKIGRFCV